MSTVTFTVAVPLLAVLAAATLSDLRTRRIPYGLTLGGAALGLLINAVTLGAGALGLAVLGFALCLICMLPLYVSGGTAAGDVKLMAMVGAFLGPMNGFMALLFTLVTGALLASLVVATRKLLRASGSIVPTASPTSEIRHTQALEKIPYATAIALGSTAAVVQPAWVTTFFQ
jgi:prepilin peptidase CpaA